MSEKVLDSMRVKVGAMDDTYVNNPKSVAGQFSASKAYAAGDYVYYNRKLYRFTAAHAAGAWTGSDASEATVSGELTAIKADLTETIRKANSTEVGVDFDIADADGNVLVEFADGHIETKNFSSKTVLQNIENLDDNKLNANQGEENEGKALVIGEDGIAVPEDISIDVDASLTHSGEAADAKATGDALGKRVRTENTTDNSADYYIADANGNVLVEFADGHIATKKFNSAKRDIHTKNTPANADLFLSDPQGNVIMQFANGHIDTAGFSSEYVTKMVLDFIYSLNNRLANPLYTTLSKYNETAETPIVNDDVLYRGVIEDEGGYRIPAICVTNEKTILVAGTRMVNALGDYGDFSVDVARKTNGGQWSASCVVPFDATREDYGSVLNNEFLVDRDSGRIYLFYGTEINAVVWWEVATEDGDFRYVYSDDDGETWSEPVSLKHLWDTDTYDYCIPSCTKGIQLTDGTYVVPCFCKKGFVPSTAKSYPLLLIKKPNEEWYFSSVASVPGVLHLDECAVVEGISENEIWLYCRGNTNYGTGVNRGYNKFVYNIGSNSFLHIQSTFDTNRHNCFGIDRIAIDGQLIYLMTFTDTNSSVREKTTLWVSLDGDVWMRTYEIQHGSSNGYSIIDNYDGTIAVAFESKDPLGRSDIACQDVSVLSELIYQSATQYIGRNISVQDRMQMLFNKANGIE